MKNSIFEEYINLFSKLTLKNINEFDKIVDKNIEFIDPFNSVKGIKSFKSIFFHMFEKIKEPKFIILDYSINNRRLFLKWEMSFFAFNFKQKIIGMSEIKCNDKGKIISHYDYWDSMNGLFIKLPLIGFFYRASLKIFSSRN
tara:strand:+ start:54 stop:479 length:426 start_codon:yes stop_codon:yes gene_type:complete